MGLVDAAIFAMAASVMITFFRHRRGIHALRLHGNVAWVVGGMVILALFYVGDLVVMFVLPGLTLPDFAMATMTDLHLNWNWLASLLAIGSITVGMFDLLGRMLLSAGDTLLRLEAELNARKLAGAALQESEKRYRDMFEDSPAAIWEEDWSAVKRLTDDFQA